MDVNTVYTTQDRRLLPNVLEPTDWWRGIASRLGQRGHVTHLRTLPEMRHAAKNSLSVVQSDQQARNAGADW